MGPVPWGHPEFRVFPLLCSFAASFSIPVVGKSDTFLLLLILIFLLPVFNLKQFAVLDLWLDFTLNQVLAKEPINQIGIKNWWVPVRAIIVTVDDPGHASSGVLKAFHVIAGLSRIRHVVVEGRRQARIARHVTALSHRPQLVQGLLRGIDPFAVAVWASFPWNNLILSSMNGQEPGASILRHSSSWKILVSNEWLRTLKNKTLEIRSYQLVGMIREHATATVTNYKNIFLINTEMLLEVGKQGREVRPVVVARGPRASLAPAQRVACVVAHRVRARHANRRVTGRERHIPSREPRRSYGVVLVVLHCLRVHGYNVVIIVLMSIPWILYTFAVLTVHVDEELGLLLEIVAFGNEYFEFSPYLSEIGVIYQNFLVYISTFAPLYWTLASRICSRYDV